MWCAIYKSSKKTGSYLYIERKDDFERVPEALLAQFLAPELVMVINLDKREHLGFADIKRVKAELVEKGFYLQLPPPVDNLLKAHRLAKGIEE
ncbi:YcgL domain-containing protein [Corallincola luteus]|uniref:YcgL domain-containing protein EZV61_06275 n=1 Tax=Corallincola luteus TaxID=1775177 RepID=A0ABY2ATP4_9GAMM|nr:YcgL domain-containing protein [Corallincola luteus]TCI05677.1 YcgL domain-containing protein [Corallincola luteus]